MKTQILFFSPSSDIWEHAFPEALIAEMLAAKGEDVSMLRCRGILRPLCPSAQAAGLNAEISPQEQQNLCKRCNAKGRLLDEKMGLRHIEIDDYVRPRDADIVEEIVGQAEKLRGHLHDARGFEQIRYRNQYVGRIALYELILKHKKNDFSFSDAVWNEYLIFLRETAWASILSERVLELEKPDRVSVYNSLYVAHRAFCLNAKELGIDQYFMHAGTNLSRQHRSMMIGKDFTWRFLRDLVGRYKEYENQAVSTASIDDVTQHFLCLLSAKNIFVYSTARSHEYFDVRAHFGVSKSQKFIVASTSSYDERFAVESVGAGPPPGTLLFPRILDWVAHLVELATARPDWFLLIRVHPREFPNRRDSVQSEHSRQLKKLLEALPSNIAVNWPDDNLSIYDLAQEADLFLNAWSSVGKEMTLLGVPVVVYSPELLLYPSSLNYVGTTKEHYLMAIEAALAAGWDFNRCKKTYRWFALEFSRSCVDLRESMPSSRSWLQRVFLRLTRSLLSYMPERCDIGRRRPMNVAASLVSRLFEQGLESSERAQQQILFDGKEDEEESAIRSNLAQLGAHLFAANPPDRPSKLQRAFIAAGILQGKYIE